MGAGEHGRDRGQSRLDVPILRAERVSTRGLVYIDPRATIDIAEGLGPEGVFVGRRPMASPPMQQHRAAIFGGITVGGVPGDP